MRDPNRDQITQMLHRWSLGHEGVGEQLFPMLYDELHRIARNFARHERPGHTLQATAILHEAYFRLIEQQDVDWQSRDHFLGMAAHVMRRVLVDYARERGRAKRGGQAEKVALEEAASLTQGKAPDLIALDDALSGLGSIDPQLVTIVELRFFAGLTIEETAEHLGISTMTVTRHWRRAKAWLYEELHRDETRTH